MLLLQIDEPQGTISQDALPGEYNYGKRYEVARALASEGSMREITSSVTSLRIPSQCHNAVCDENKLIRYTN